MRITEVDASTLLDRLGLHGQSSQAQHEYCQAIVEWIKDDRLGQADLREEWCPKNPPPGVLSALSRRTNIYVNISGVTNEQFFVLLATLVGLGANGAAGGGLALIVAEIRALWKRVGRLNEEQAEAARRLVRLMDGRSVYDTPVALTDYLATWPPDEDRKARALLSELKKLGLVDDTLNGWTFVR